MVEKKKIALIKRDFEKILILSNLKNNSKGFFSNSQSSTSSITPRSTRGDEPKHRWLLHTNPILCMSRKRGRMFKSIIRFFEDIIGYFMEKVPPAWKVVILGGIALVIFLTRGLQAVLNTLAICLWIVTFFMFGKLLFNLIRDRNKNGSGNG